MTNKKIKCITVVGARPQFIKASAFSAAIREHNQTSETQVQDIIVHTGQHFDSNMSQVFFDELNITAPKYSLGIHSTTHGAMTGRMMEKLDEIFLSEKPDIVLVYGDTNSTLAAALCASKLHIPVAHVEAGLRAFNKKIPEEVNRILTDRISDYLFCPSEKSVIWLKNEGLTKCVYNSGDIMYDTTLMFSKKNPTKSIAQLVDEFSAPPVVCTVHRAENTDSKEKLQNIISALQIVAKETQVLFLVHPRTAKAIERYGINMNGLTTHEPVSYVDLLNLVQSSHCVMTDSGGLQKEAYFLNRPCVTMRNETEWTETIEVGANILVGSDKNKIIKAYNEFKNKKLETKPIYGNGKTATDILNKLLQQL